VQVRQAKVLLQAAGQALAAGTLVGQPGEWAVAEFLPDHLGEQVILGRKVVVERPPGQANGFHQAGNARAGKAPALGQRTAAGEQAFTGLLLVFVWVAHGRASARRLDESRHSSIAFVY